MTKEEEVVRSVFDAYIRDAKATSTKKDRPTFDMLEEVKNMAIKALEQQPCEDCVSRAEVIKSIQSDINISFEGQRALEKYAEDIKLIIWCLLDEQEKKIKALPPVTPTHGTCKDCKHSIYLDSDCYRKEYYYCKKYDLKGVDISKFYCADFEKRGNENEVN